MIVGDVVMAGKQMFRISGIYIGAVGMQNMVGLKPMTKHCGYAKGNKIEEMLVPEELVSMAEIYRLAY